MVDPMTRARAVKETRVELQPDGAKRGQGMSVWEPPARYGEPRVAPACGAKPNGDPVSLILWGAEDE